MSELTICNYCKLKRIRKTKSKGSKVYLKPSSFMSGGIDVYVVPKGEKLDTRTDKKGN